MTLPTSNATWTDRTGTPHGETFTTEASAMRAVARRHHPAWLCHAYVTALGGWCSTGVYGGGRDPLGGRERFNGWSPLSILLLAVGFEGCGE